VARNQARRYADIARDKYTEAKDEAAKKYEAKKETTKKYEAAEKNKNINNTYIHKASSKPRLWFSKEDYDTIQQKLNLSEIMETEQDTTEVANSKSQNVGINPFKSFVPEFSLGTFVYYNDESSMMKPESVIIICALVFITLYYFCTKSKRNVHDGSDV
jgi:hypothetical protein